MGKLLKRILEGLFKGLFIIVEWCSPKIEHLPPKEEKEQEGSE